MKNTFLLTALLGTASVMVSCQHEEDPEVTPATGSVRFVIGNEVDGQPLQTGSLLYTNAAGNVYSVDKLLYYISNMTFVRSDGSFYKAPENYELIDQDKAESQVFTLSGIPTGDYTALRFYVGIDSLRSFSGAMEGDLDPVYGMLWDWQTGYIYLKHEGVFIDSTGNQNALLYHYGKLKALVSIEVPVSLNVSTNQRTVDLKFNLNKIYHDPNTIDFNGNNIHQSTSAADMIWVELIRENFQGAFEVDHIE